MKAEPKMKRGDFIMLLIAGVVVVGLFLWRFISNNSVARHGDAVIAKIERNGKTVKEIDLTKVKETESIVLEDNGIKVTIVVESGRICFLESECPDQICVNTGWLTKLGDVAACLPAKTIVSIF